MAIDCVEHLSISSSHVVDGLLGVERLNGFIYFALKYAEFALNSLSGFNMSSPRGKNHSSISKDNANNVIL